MKKILPIICYIVIMFFLMFMASLIISFLVNKEIQKNSVTFLCQAEFMFHHLECWEFIGDKTIDYSEHGEPELGIRNYWEVRRIGGELLWLNKDDLYENHKYMFFKVIEIKDAY